MKEVWIVAEVGEGGSRFIRSVYLDQAKAEAKAAELNDEDGEPDLYEAMNYALADVLAQEEP